jgi:hypothetical protein
MSHPLDGIPELDPAVWPVPMADGGRALVTLFRAFEPSDPRLQELWPRMIEVIEGLASADETFPIPIIQHVRYSLEGMGGENECSDLMLGAAKHLVTAFLLWTSNPFRRFRDEWTFVHDDITPLLTKGIELANEAKQKPFDGAIEINDRRPEELSDFSRDDMLEGLIRNAIRPKRT